MKTRLSDNVVWLEDSQIVQDYLHPGGIPLPELLIIEVTTRCNLRCIMCAKQADKSPTGNEPRDIELEVFDQLEDVLPLIPNVCLTGYGESLLHPQITDMIERCKAHGCCVHITSNGTLLTPNVVEKVVKSGLDYLNISLDAATKEVYRQIRQGGNFEKIIAGIQHLNCLKATEGLSTPRLALTFVPMAPNVVGLPAYIKLAHELCIEVVHLNNFVDYGAHTGLNLRNAPEQTRQAYQEAFALASSLGVRVTPGYPRALQEAQGCSSQPQPEEGTANSPRKGCIIPWLHIFVTAMGDVLPCCNASDQDVTGNLYEQSLKEIWHGEAHQTFRRRLLSSDPPECCRHCVCSQPPQRTQQCLPYVEMGAQETLGWGWNPLEPEQDSRWTQEHALLFLKNIGPATLVLHVGTLVFRSAAGRVLVNGSRVGRFRILPGWSALKFGPLDFKTDVLAVEILIDSINRVAEQSSLWKICMSFWAFALRLVKRQQPKLWPRQIYLALNEDIRPLGVRVRRVAVEP